MVTPVDKEQLSGTAAVLSCTVRGLTRQIDAVTWTRSDSSVVTSGEDGLTVEHGTVIGSSQTTTLTVAGSHNNRDVDYKCLITSNEHGLMDTAVILKVFSECAKKEVLK